MGARITSGTLSIRVGDTTIKVRGNVRVNTGKELRESEVGQDGVHGFRARPQVPYVELQATLDTVIDYEAIKDIEDATVQVDMANGESYILRNAWFVGEGQEDLSEGTGDIRFDGLSMDKTRDAAA